MEAELCIEHGVLIATMAVTQEKFERQEEPLYLNVQLEGVSV